MGFFDIWRPKNNEHQKVDVIDCRTLFNPEGLEFQARELAFLTCINLIAKRIGLCTMRQFRENQEYKGREWWMWNMEPNRSQNATVFWHKLITRLYMDGEALIIEEPYRAGDESGVVVADSFYTDDSKPTHVYKSVAIGQRSIERLPENKVMHFVLSNKKIGPLVQKMGDSFLRLMAVAQNNYQYNGAPHWKVHVNQMITADNEWYSKFQQILEKQIKPFLNGTSAVLPEVEGYNYTQISGGGVVSSDEYRKLYKDIWHETATAFGIPAVLIDGSVADTSKATETLLTDVIDPIATQITQEANRKRYSYEDYTKGNYLLLDTSTISHYDLLANAGNVEKLVGSGIWSVNEIREKLGDTPINEPWANEHFLTKNIGTTTTATKEDSEA